MSPGAHVTVPVRSLVALAAVTAVGCAPSAEVVARAIDARDADAHRLFDAEVASVERELGAARFDPPTEDRLLQHARARVAFAPDPRVEILKDEVDGGPARLGYVEMVGGDCVTNWSPPASQARFARSDGGVRLIIVEPEVERVVRHVSGTCSPPGCGAQPPPPVARIHWLPIADVQQLSVEHRRVHVVMETIACDRPSYPP